VRTYGTLRFGEDKGRTFGGSFWIISAEPHVTMRLKRIFGRVDPRRDGTLVISDTPETAADLEWVLGRWPLVLDEASRSRLEVAARGYRESQEAVDKIFGGDRLPFRMTPAREPRDYQLVAADVTLTTGRLLLTDDIGLGKTFTGLLVLRDPEARPALVVCPTHLTRQWLAELHISFPTLRGHIAQRATPYNPSLRRDMGGHYPDVLIMSYSKLAGWSQHLVGWVRTVIFDEIQDLRVAGSQKYTAAAMIADAARVKLGMTASPVYNYGGEIYNVMRILDVDALGTRAEFVQEWGAESGKKVAVRDPRALGSFLREENLMLRRTRADVGRELGDLVRVPHDVDADPDVIERETADATSLATLILSGDGNRQERFQAAGDLDWQMRRATGLAKAPYVAAFVQLLLESEAKVVLFGWHRDVYAAWQERFRRAEIGFVMYTGSESPAAKQRAKDAFLDDDDCRVFVMSLRSGAGLDGLQQACSVAVFGELDWSPAMHDQCLSADTEILTPGGWAQMGEVATGDEVAAFDRETEEISWRPARRVIERGLAGGEEIYEMKLPGVDLRVTGDHRIVYQQSCGAGHRKMSGWKVDTAAKLASGRSWYRIPVAGYEEGVGIPLTDSELSFLGWWITDGTLSNQRTRATPGLVICQAQASPHNGHIRQTLDGCGFAWTVAVRDVGSQFDRRSPMLHYSVPKKRSTTRLGRGWEELAPYLDKDLSPLLDDMTSNQLAVFMEAVHYGDGDKQGKVVPGKGVQRSYHVGTARRLFADRLQSLLIRRGWRANVIEKKTPLGRPYFKINTKPGAIRSIKGSQQFLRVDPREGERVWCVENDLGTLVVRRHGKAAIVGNCLGRLHRDGQDDPVVGYFLTCDYGSDPTVMEVLGVKRGQAEPMMDPTVELFERMEPRGDRVRMLARSVLDRGVGARVRA
jgi:superfamily II DNA or RNA helicase